MAKLVVLAGLSGAGKSTIARQLARRLGAIWLRINSMDQAIWASGTAPSDLRDWTYRAAQAVAADNLSLGRDVIADCVNDCQEARDGWRESAARAGVEVFWLEIVCTDPMEHRRRVETRTSEIRGLVLPNWQAVMTREFHPWNCDRVTIDTACQTVEECVREALTALQN